MKRILLVEDDMMIGSGLVYALDNEGYQATHCKDIVTAVAATLTGSFDLAILDLQLPDGTGFDISRRLRNTDTQTIFLTIVDDEDKIVKAFDEGAADYITKPFKLRELLARVRRTLSSGESQDTLTVGNVTIDTGAARVFAGGSQVELTALECSPEGSTIFIDSGENPIYRWISITDSGAGMENVQCARIFKRFEYSKSEKGHGDLTFRRRDTFRSLGRSGGSV